MTQIPMVILSSIYFILNTVFWCTGFYPLILADFVVQKFTKLGRIKKWERRLAELWISTNNLYLTKVLSLKAVIHRPKNLDRKTSYLVFSNHQSWVDILILQIALNREAPFLRFFIKDSLKWVPFLGGAWAALDMPFMKRYSAELIKRQPDLKKRDLETAKAACDKLRGVPVSILIFLEGTRYTVEKALEKKSQYQNLLKPKTGGANAVMQSLGQQIKTVLDVTIAYDPKANISLLRMLGGKMDKAIVEINEIEIPEKFRTMQGDQNNSEGVALKEEFESWIAEIWARKDQRLQYLKENFDSL